MPVYSAHNELLHKHAELDSSNWLNILDNNLNTDYQVPIDNIKHIINFSNPDMPSGYYQEFK